MFVSVAQGALRRETVVGMVPIANPDFGAGVRRHADVPGDGTTVASQRRVLSVEQVTGLAVVSHLTMLKFSPCCSV
jgi:hypothetical protein